MRDAPQNLILRPAVQLLGSFVPICDPVFCIAQNDRIEAEVQQFSMLRQFSVSLFCISVMPRRLALVHLIGIATVPCGRDFFNCGQQVTRQSVFVDVSASAHFGGLAGYSGRIILTYDDHRGRVHLAANDAGCLNAIHSGHGHVHQDDVWAESLGFFNCFHTVLGFAAYFPFGPRR